MAKDTTAPKYEDDRMYSVQLRKAITVGSTTLSPRGTQRLMGSICNANADAIASATPDGERNQQT